MRKAIHKKQAEVVAAPSDLVDEKLLASADLVNREDALQRNTAAKRTGISAPRRRPRTGRCPREASSETTASRTD
jgi:hypothetical protein